MSSITSRTIANEFFFKKLYWKGTLPWMFPKTFKNIFERLFFTVSLGSLFREFLLTGMVSAGFQSTEIWKIWRAKNDLHLMVYQTAHSKKICSQKFTWCYNDGVWGLDTRELVTGFNSTLSKTKSLWVDVIIDLTDNDDVNFTICLRAFSILSLHSRQLKAFAQWDYSDIFTFQKVTCSLINTRSTIFLYYFKNQ